MNWTLLSKYLSDECTPAEEEKVRHWLNASRDNREFFDTLARIWRVEPDNNTGVNAKAAWYSFKEKLTDEKKGNGPSLRFTHNHSTKRTKTKSRTTFRRWIAGSAAAALAAVAVMMYFGMVDFVSKGRQQAGKEQEVQEISTEAGQRASFRLADGTLVYLNAESRIRIQPSFGDGARSLQLQGEAYFDVTSDPDTPFLAHSGNSYTRVLGTRFGIKAYPEDKQVRVAVEEGEVRFRSSVNDTAENLHLTANNIGVLDSDGRITVQKTDDMTKYLAWKEGRLVFRSTPFGEVIPGLERWYNIDIESDSFLISQRITATFKDEPMLEVLNILALSLNADLERSGREVKFISK